MNLLIDIDGVVVTYDFPRIIKKHFGITIPNKAVYTYSLEDALGVPPADVIKMFEEEVFAPPNFVAGSISALKHFIANNHEVGIYTNRNMWMTANELEDWLTRYGIPYSSIITNSTLPSYVHMYVDDSPAKLMAVDRATEVKNLLLFHNPWNKSCLNITGQMTRVKSWRTVRNIVDGKRFQ